VLGAEAEKRPCRRKGGSHGEKGEGERGEKGRLFRGPGRGIDQYGARGGIPKYGKRKPPIKPTCHHKSSSTANEGTPLGTSQTHQKKEFHTTAQPEKIPPPLGPPSARKGGGVRKRWKNRPKGEKTVVGESRGVGGSLDEGERKIVRRGI